MWHPSSGPIIAIGGMSIWSHGYTHGPPGKELPPSALESVVEARKRELAT